jgi:drug/metabolite transporter (DMT)-like permease
MSHRSAVALMVLVTLLWSIAGVITRHLDSARSFEVTFWRSLFNAAALVVAFAFLREGPRLQALLRAPRIVWMSGLCWAAMFTAFMVAITLTTVATVLITMSIAPLVTALFARVFLGYRLPARTWSAVTVAGVGIAWMFLREIDAGAPFLGTLVALAVPLAAAINWTMLQHVAHGGESAEPSDMLPAVFIGAVVSAAATLPLAWPLQAGARDVALLAVLGVFQLAIPCLIAVRLTRILPAPEIALIAVLEVLFGVAWTWIGAGERPGSNALLGGALVLGALLANEVAGSRRKVVGPAP